MTAKLRNRVLIQMNDKTFEDTYHLAAEYGKSPNLTIQKCVRLAMTVRKTISSGGRILVQDADGSITEMKE